ncbi:unnamed protein product [Gadus morhua 'NCC']
MKNSHRAAGNFQTAARLTWGRFWWRVLAEQPRRRPKPNPVPLIQNTEISQMWGEVSMTQLKAMLWQSSQRRL